MICLCMNSALQTAGIDALLTAIDHAGVAST
jgi:hypothetical protein